MDFVIAILKESYRFNMNDLIFFRNFKFQIHNEKTAEKFQLDIKNPSNVRLRDFLFIYSLQTEVCVTLHKVCVTN